MKACIEKLFLSVVVAGLVILNGSAAGAQLGGIPLWTNYYDSGSFYAGLADLAVDRGGNVFVTGNGLVTIKYSDIGTPLWTNYFRGPGNTRYYAARAIALDSNGNALVTGDSSGDSATIKYSAAGVPLWTNYISGTAIADIAVDASGKVFITGSNAGSITLAYSNGGARLWTNRYAGANGGARAVAVDSNGNVLVTGAATIKYSGAGVPLWTNGAAGYAVAVDASGNVVVLGNGIRKYSNSGAPLWTNFFPGAGGPAALALDSSGNVLVAGWYSGDSSSFNNFDFLTIKYSGVGVLLWTNRFNGPDNVGDSAFSIALDNSGNVFVHGETFEDAGGDGSYFINFTTVGYSSGGVPLWTNIYNPGGGLGFSALTQGKSVAVDPNGNVIAAGTSLRNSQPGIWTDHYVVVKYSSVIPLVTISRTGTNTIAVSWPSPSTGFGLQQNSNGVSSLNWGNVSTGIQDDGTNKTFIVNPPAGTRFYRLYKP